MPDQNRSQAFMNEKPTILVILPDGSVHRATLIEPGLGIPLYRLGRKASERKPRTEKAEKSEPESELPRNQHPSTLPYH